jgi:carbonic anhydrase
MKQFPQRLIEGYEAFRAGHEGSQAARYRMLAERGQNPTIMMIGCCDSRVPPEVIFGAGPGEIFVARNVANLVPPYSPDHAFHGTSAALEFGVIALGVQHLVIMGHGRCGGIRAALEDSAPLSTGDFIGSWMTIAAEPAAAVLADATLTPAQRQRALELAVVQLSVRNLMTFPWIASRVASGALQLHGAWFDVGEGLLHVLDHETGLFAPVDAG